MSKINPEFGYGGNYDDNEPTPPERYSGPAKPANEFDSDIPGFKPPEEHITEEREYTKPSTISHEGGLSPLVFRTHIETSGEGEAGVPEFYPGDLASVEEVLRWAKKRFPKQPAPDDPEGRSRTKKYSVDGIGSDGKQVLWSRPEGPEQLPPSWVTLPTEPNDGYEITRRAWKDLGDVPASGENEGSDLYREWFDRWAARNAETLGGLGLQELPGPQEELGDQ